MKPLLIAMLMATMALAGAQKERAASYCTPDGGDGAVKCGGASYDACIVIHANDDLCSLEGPMPSCCAASPDSPDRTAKECHCCAGHHMKSNITIPYDEL